MCMRIKVRTDRYSKEAVTVDTRIVSLNRVSTRRRCQMKYGHFDIWRKFVLEFCLLFLISRAQSGPRADLRDEFEKEQN